jgi:hypothetical protein
MSLFSLYILSLILKPLTLVDSVQVLSFGKHSSQKNSFIKALIMSFHDLFNAFVCPSNQCDYVPSKNSGRKLSHFVAILSRVPIQALFYFPRNTSRSSPLLPLKTGITMLLCILSYFFLKDIKKTHQTN